MTDEHSSPIKTPRQLIIVVLLAFAVPISLAALISQLVTSGEKGKHEDDSKVLGRIQPVGNVVLAEASGPKGMLFGEKVYAQVCKACHDAGLAGAPKFGDKTAWGARIATGEATLAQHAIAGFQGKSGVMPAKGGNADLTDDEVRRAVVFMANAAGATWKEPAVAQAPATTASAAPVAASTTAPATVSAPAAAAAAPVAAAAPAAQPDGRKVFEGNCAVCHGAGIAGAPRFGDKAAWAPRIAQGVPTLYTHAIGGFTGKAGAMPPKGGNLALPDADVKAAVDYMVSAAK
ncbi:MAG TPA: c-type cytochrome [Casimicrobiaceae bacterium]|nr:c-type cytochrome [Casimicrobiaceae bacterium]